MKQLTKQKTQHIKGGDIIQVPGSQFVGIPGVGGWVQRPGSQGFAKGLDGNNAKK